MGLAELKLIYLGPAREEIKVRDSAKIKLGSRLNNKRVIRKPSSTSVYLCEARNCGLCQKTGWDQPIKCESPVLDGEIIKT